MGIDGGSARHHFRWALQDSYNAGYRQAVADVGQSRYDLYGSPSKPVAIADILAELDF
jgi:hypothetical protein